MKQDSVDELNTAQKQVASHLEALELKFETKRRKFKDIERDLSSRITGLQKNKADLEHETIQLQETLQQLQCESQATQAF